MKPLLTLLTIFFFCSISSRTFAQFDILNKIEKKVEKKAEDETDSVIDKGINKTASAIKNNGKKEDNEKNIDNKAENPNVAGNENNTSNEPESKNELQIYSKYDFIPGDKIIFEDNLAGEESGEFPSRWDLLSGSAENASLGNEKVIHLINDNTIILPLMDKKDFLPDVFTIEFDAYFEKLAVTSSDYYAIRFFPGVGGSFLTEGGKSIYPINVSWNLVKMGDFGGYTASFNDERENWQGKWKHIAISFNKRSLKLYLDEERMLNIPNLGYKPGMFSIGVNFDPNHIKMCSIKNIRVNEGGKKLYDRILAEGKFITRGILFEVNKANITPQSMGTINEIANLMKEHPDLKFSIEGHTDSDGDKTYNQKLSEERAQAVKDLLFQSGIDASRLETKGWGDSKPIDSNSTPEGKANNRRVEFVKI